MTESTFAIKGQAYVFYVSLLSQADKDIFQVNPTLAAGDVKVSIDGGALNNLATLPVVTPAGSKLVKVSLSAAEMNGDQICVVFSDAAGDEWCDWTEMIYPLSSSLAAQVWAYATRTLTSYATPLSGATVDWLTGSPFDQDANESKTYDFEFASFGTPTSPTVALKDDFGNDISSTNIAGAASISGTVVTSGVVSGLKKGFRYWLSCKATIGSEIVELSAEIHCTK